MHAAIGARSGKILRPYLGYKICIGLGPIMSVLSEKKKVFCFLNNQFNTKKPFKMPIIINKNHQFFI